MRVLNAVVTRLLSIAYWLLPVGRVWLLVCVVAPTFILVSMGVAGWLGVPDDARASAVPLTALAVFVALLTIYVHKHRTRGRRREG